MAEKITLEEALNLVEFEFTEGEWRVKHVKRTVWGDVKGDVYGTIDGRPWEFFDTPRQKLRRLIGEGADKAQLLEAINQLEVN